MNTLKFGNGEWYGKKDTILAYNDENSNFKPLPFSFDRASSATRVNKEGLIETVGSGEPRVDYKDDSKGALLLEPSRSNIFDYSSDLSAWSKLNSTVTESSVLSLDGVNNSYGYERTSSSSSYIYRTVSLANTTQYTLSFFVKSGTSTNVRTDIWDTTQSTQCEIQVDLETKAISNFTGTSYKIEDYTNGWLRISVVFTSESSFGTTFNRYFNADSVGSELYIWGAQLEQGSYPTSYIPTQGGIGTRVAEVCEQTPPSGVIGQTEGTLFVETSKWVESNNGRFFSISDGTTSNYIIIIQNTTFSNYAVYISNGGITQLSYSATNTLPNNSKIAISYKLNNFVVSVNGEIVHTDTSGTLPSTSKIYIGSRENGATTYYSSNPIKDARLYNTRLSNIELQALTT